ncbi:MAG TPA: alpha/beta fold hydrolase [Solirubrobacteraceae bacterium]|nr:alpha/beta fold hydrolase [Solirubrobacteraceae bacterium]
MAPSLLQRQLLRVRNGVPYYAGLKRAPVAQTPRDLVWQRDTARLWRYRSHDRKYAPPVLIIHSLISQAYILDLLPDNSMVGFLVDEGFDVYLLDWGRAYPADAQNTLETYVEDYIPKAMAAACAFSEADELSLAGYCLGGVLALLVAAADSGPRIRNLIALTTPCDFSELGFLSQMFVEGRLDPADVIDSTGIVPARALDQGFQSIKPTDAVVQQVNVLQNLWNDQWLTGFIAMNKWTRDQVPLPGAVFRQIVEILVRDNALAKGTVPLGQREVSLGDIECPVMNVFCRRDEIVPPRSATPLAGLVGSEDVTELCLESGHVGLVAGRQAAKVSRPQIADWIRARSDKPQGSARRTQHPKRQKPRREASDDARSARKAAR